VNLAKETRTNWGKRGSRSEFLQRIKEAPINKSIVWVVNARSKPSSLIRNGFGQTVETLTEHSESADQAQILLII